MSFLDGLDMLQGADKVEPKPAKIEMAADDFIILKDRMITENRTNVYANKFDVSQPYRVSIEYSNAWTNYGTFSDINAACGVSVICGVSVFGAKAVRAVFDQAAAEVHPEYIAWTEDERNAPILKAFQVQLIKMKQAAKAEQKAA